ncbi:hypothetical protein SAMN02745132_03446 [Enterovibrio nigricans DSM 22720]|uniref:Uncharacterized protein n=2 Tax=Enterovibrio nigricans TaxID=504469 RepID=A0A1T4V8N7_9GAMM|nr:hypothetical protein SAMN02745132_03446 [Enterovibrio nigricans DSM 22720]
MKTVINVVVLVVAIIIMQPYAHSSQEVKIALVIGSDKKKSSPSNLEKLCISNGISALYENIKIRIIPNGHSNYGTIEALENLGDSQGVAMPLLTSELPDIGVIHSLVKNKKTVITSSRDIPEEYENIYSITTSVKEQVSYLIGHLDRTKKVLLITYNDAYSKLLTYYFRLKSPIEFHEMDVEDFINLNNIENLPSTIVITSPLSESHKIFRKTNEDKTRKYNLLSFDQGHLIKSAKDKFISIENEKDIYSWVKNWDGKTIGDNGFLEVFNYQCRDLQERPTYLNIATYESIMAVFQLLRSKEANPYFKYTKVDILKKIKERNFGMYFDEFKR